MPREAEGGAFESRGKLFARVTIAPKKRKAIRVPRCATLEEATTRGQEMQALVDQLRASGHARGIEKTIKAAAGLDGEGMRKLRRLVERIVAGKEPAPWDRPAVIVDGETFETFARKWATGELARAFPDHVEVKRSAYTDLCWLRKYAFPVVGPLPLAAFQLEHFEQILAEAAERAKTRQMRGGKTRASRDMKLSPRSRQAIAQAVRRVLQLAEYPAKLIARNPVPSNAVPKARQLLALQYLYPDEDAKHLANEGTDLGYRLLLGFLARMGWRKSEALGGKLDRVPDAVIDEDDDANLEDLEPLTWSRIDLVRGVVLIDRDKTGQPRPIALDGGTHRALKAWHKRWPKAKPSDRVFVYTNGAPIETERAAEAFREHLTVSKIDRPELLDSSATRRKIRLHDLRASFVTVALANGRDETYVKDRTGHVDERMLARYRRAARTFEELHLGDWTPLDQAIPELVTDVAAAEGPFSGSTEDPSTATTNGKPSDSEWGDRRGLNPRRLEPQAGPSVSASTDKPERSASVNVQSARGDTSGTPALAMLPLSEHVDALERAIVEAVLAGRWEIAEELRALLAERRRNSRPANVVPFDTKRPAK